jgi:hypothetical protein
MQVSIQGWFYSNPYHANIGMRLILLYVIPIWLIFYTKTNINLSTKVPTWYLAHTQLIAKFQGLYLTSLIFFIKFLKVVGFAPFHQTKCVI